MTSPTDAPDTGAAAEIETETNLGREFVHGALSAGLHPTVGGAVPAPAGIPISATAAAASLLSYHQANLAAVLRSGQVLAAGAQDMRRDWADASAAALKDAHDAMAALASVRCVKDLMDVQSKVLRTTMERAFARGAHVAGASMTLTQPGPSTVRRPHQGCHAGRRPAGLTGPASVGICSRERTCHAPCCRAEATYRPYGLGPPRARGGGGPGGRG